MEICTITYLLIIIMSRCAWRVGTVPRERDFSIGGERPEKIRPLTLCRRHPIFRVADSISRRFLYIKRCANVHAVRRYRIFCTPLPVYTITTTFNFPGSSRQIMTIHPVYIQEEWACIYMYIYYYFYYYVYIYTAGVYSIRFLVDFFSSRRLYIYIYIFFFFFFKIVFENSLLPLERRPENVLAPVPVMNLVTRLTIAGTYDSMLFLFRAKSSAACTSLRAETIRVHFRGGWARRVQHGGR